MVARPVLERLEFERLLVALSVEVRPRLELLVFAWLDFDRPWFRSTSRVREDDAEGADRVDRCRDSTRREDGVVEGVRRSDLPRSTFLVGAFFVGRCFVSFRSTCERRDDSVVRPRSRDWALASVARTMILSSRAASGIQCPTPNRDKYFITSSGCMYYMRVHYQIARLTGEL